ncbi:transposase [Fontisphaera persica]|uniref:transposase n=1 Tax=Fontisphaera persica TaxID=2974023 RepID=UPI0024BF3421|nr:transposase [Fontisphaera persica]WCJ59507.1 transposase [Fontisphaera persica]
MKTCTLVDATLVQAARRPPSRRAGTTGDPDARFTVKRGQPHYGYKAHVGVDRTHLMIRRVSLTGAHVHDSREFARVAVGDEQMVVADKAYWGEAQRQWCVKHQVANGIRRRAKRGEKLRPGQRPFNWVLSRMRSGVERVIGGMKHWAGYRRVRYLGREPNRLELEFKSLCWKMKRLVKVAAG